LAQRSAADESASPVRESGPARDSLSDAEKGYSFHADCERRAKRLEEAASLLGLAYADYMRERQRILDAVSPGVIVAAGTHPPSNPTLDKQHRLEALRFTYRDDLRRYRAVSRVLRWLRNPFGGCDKIKIQRRGRPETVRPEDEGYYRLFLAMLEAAANDILKAPVGSSRFESAAEWLTEGWGYQVMREITDGGARLRDYWRQIADDRRGGLTRAAEDAIIDRV
jgi:hypothetical protein